MGRPAPAGHTMNRPGFDPSVASRQLPLSQGSQCAPLPGLRRGRSLGGPRGESQKMASWRRCTALRIRRRLFFVCALVPPGDSKGRPYWAVTLQFYKPQSARTLVRALCGSGFFFLCAGRFAGRAAAAAGAPAAAGAALFAARRAEGQHHKRPHQSEDQPVQHAHASSAPSRRATKAAIQATPHCISTTPRVLSPEPSSRRMAATAATQGV